MDKPFQRKGSISNAHVGKEFEITAQAFFQKNNLILERNIKIDLGVEQIKKTHAFDLGSLKQKIIVECKSNTWTSGNKVPSAKLTVWNEAMYYFLIAPDDFRKIMFVLHDFCERRSESLAQYYLRRYYHLIPNSVELWEYNPATSVALKLKKI